MQPFTLRVIEVIKSIPEGSIMTYGQIAEQAGSRRAARQVVRILHSLSGIHNLPWHRVVNAKGEIAIPDEESRYMQTVILQGEGVEVSKDGRVDVDKYRYYPVNEEEIF
ncbi:DNA methyltransferase [Paenibacillus sp. FSL H8-0548]|uniref:MGMT family protein n=1 Tax=Paenibacillus sp. FSL H8-0548 TaxID=1920422 RepID=UPI00096F1FD7|nr:MGMT family protein [Paenibacillus sp. FSL H8-0548]OMF30039.1 DNA methyltransferase [Paenibacillus sp. FSL H8-0548]